nr:glycosyltransferase [uncultured Erwinia sp.]
MKRILILSHTQGYSDFKIGSHHYANGMNKLGCEVYFSGIPETIFHKLLNKRKQKGSRKIDENVIESQVGSFLPLTLKNNKIFTGLNKLSFMFHKKNRELKKIHFDIVICDYPFFKNLLLELKYKKLIYRPTDDYVAMSGDKTIDYEKYLCEISDAIVTTSQVVSDGIKERYNISNEKIKVISNGYDDLYFKVEFIEGQERKDAIYIGALDNRFDFDALKFLASNRKRINFNIYGPLSQDYHSRKSELDLLDNVHFHDKVDYEKTCSLMNQHKVGLLLLTNIPSNKGRSPMKLWEYIGSGLNVLYANIDGVNNSECLFKYSNYEEILYFFDKAYGRDNLGDGEILKDHSWSGKVKKLYELSLN